jgi:hypothetical protein
MLAAHGTGDLAIAATSMLLIWLVYLVRERSAVGKDFRHAPVWLRWGAYLGLTAGILFFNMDSNAGFIYFNF